MVKTGSIIRLQGVRASFNAPQLPQKLIIPTFENGKDRTVTCSSIWSEEAGVNYFVFDSHLKPKNRVQFVPRPFVPPPLRMDRILFAAHKTPKFADFSSADLCQNLIEIGEKRSFIASTNRHMYPPAVLKYFLQIKFPPDLLSES